MLARLTARLVAGYPKHPATRALIYSTLGWSSSRALFITISVVFFIKSVGLSAGEVGLGLTLAAVVALFAGVPAGHLADRVGPRIVAVTTAVVRAGLPLAYLLVDDFAGFVLVATSISVLDTAGGAANGALIAGAIPAEERVRTRAFLRSVTNVGWAFGGVGAGIALHLNTRGAYAAVLVTCTLLTLTAAGLLLRVPAVPAVPKAHSGPGLMALRDRPYVTLAALNGILCIHYGMLNVAVPLWVVQRTNAPAWVVGGLALMNAVAVILFQVRASRGITEAVGAGAAQRVSGFLLAGACLLYGLSGNQPAWLAIAFLFAAAAVHVMGELLQAAGSWGISFDLAPAHAQGQYQGLYSTGFSMAAVLAPAVLATVVIGWGWPGWILFAFIYAITGMAVPIAVRWARRTRVPVPVTTPA